MPNITEIYSLIHLASPGLPRPRCSGLPPPALSLHYYYSLLLFPDSECPQHILRHMLTTLAVQRLVPRQDKSMDESHALHAAVHLTGAATQLPGCRLNARRCKYVVLIFTAVKKLKPCGSNRPPLYYSLLIFRF